MKGESEERKGKKRKREKDERVKIVYRNDPYRNTYLKLLNAQNSNQYTFNFNDTLK